jgi:GNAT superfamily N-acetyltransferase
MGALTYLTGDSSILYKCEELSGEYFAYLKKKNKALQPTRWSERERQYNRCYNSHVVVCEDSANHYPVGYCIVCLYDRGRRGVIEELYVREELRNAGVGSKLMQFAVKWLMDQNIKQQELLVKYGNETALRFCEKFDFVPQDYVLIRK